MNLVNSLRKKLEEDRCLLLTIKVVPKSSKNEFVGTMPDGALKVKVSAPPDKGKANEELCRFLSGLLGVPLKNVSVKSGQSSTQKLVQVLF